jgi:CheY-like chemotaxis protein
VAAMKLQFVLEQAGYEVQAATNRKQALALLAEFSADKIICDVMMPEVDGSGLCRKVREREQMRHAFIVSFSYSLGGGK